MPMNHQEQLDALASLVDDWAIKKDKRVKGEFTSVDFVTFKLNQIFTPGGWSFSILDGPTMVTINETRAYTLLTGRLEVRFADGQEAHQDDVGIWPLVATGAREGKPLTDTAPERYETVLKAARTDCLKNAARNLGTCFAPLTDLALREAKKRAAYQNCDPDRDEGTRSAKEDIPELYGPQETATKAEKPPEPESDVERGAGPPPPPETAQGSPDNSLDRLLTDVNAILAEKALDTYNHVNHITNSLKKLGYTSYKPALHEEMVEKLVARKAPPPGATPEPLPANSPITPLFNLPIEDITNEMGFWITVLANLNLDKGAALELVGKNALEEIPGNDYQGKYGTIVLAQRRVAMSK